MPGSYILGTRSLVSEVYICMPVRYSCDDRIAIGDVSLGADKV